jgi:hypothetical protein
MPPGIHSRYLFCQGLLDSEGRTYLSDRVPFPYKQASDNRSHVVVEGDTLFQLAHELFDPLERPSQYFWVIADFQPEPIIDATLKLQIGSTLIVPSVRMLVEEILNESRRDQFTG